MNLNHISSSYSFMCAMYLLLKKLKKHTIGSVISIIKYIYYWFIQKRYKKYITKRSLDKKIRVVFMALFDSTWKCDTVYRKMLDDDRFEPIILLCPVVNYGYENMITRMDDCAKYFKSKGYDYVYSYNKESSQYIDILSLEPDVIFYTNPYKGLIDNRYYIDQFYNKCLTVYLPYAICNGSCYVENYDLEMMNGVWRFYLESQTHVSFAKNYGHCNGYNAFVSGHPCIEVFLDDKRKVNDVWKIQDKNYKRIIWAPHHTITPTFNLDFSCFLTYCEYMKSLAKKYKDRIQIAFKPHPLLRNKLNELWGIEKTDAYYKWWQENDNTFLTEGEYTDLFLGSDAMIHDSGSFVTEYLYVNKPVMRTLSKTKLADMFNEFGLKCLDQYYFAYNESDIEKFIQNVIADIDPMKDQRTKFLNDVLIPKNGLPSDNIINDIVDSIKNHQKV